MYRCFGAKKKVWAWLLCISFISIVSLTLEIFNTLVFASGSATSRYNVETCLQVSLDGGSSYGTIKDKLGSSGIERTYPNGAVITSDVNKTNVKIDINNDCITTKAAHWAENADYYRIKIDESKIYSKTSNVSELKFRFVSTIIWSPNSGINWSAVDFRSVLNHQNNTNDYNKIIGFCRNNDCPISTSMYATMDNDSKKINYIESSSTKYSNDSMKHVESIKLYTGNETTTTFGITTNYAVNNSISGNTVIINRCDQNGNGCGDQGTARASADAFLELTYKSYTKRSLTAYARPDTSTYFKKDGSTTTNQSDSNIWTNKATVNYGSSATVTTKDFNPAGYSWNKWGTSCDSVTTRDCKKSSLTSNTSVYAYYTRNSFQGNIYVSGTLNFGDGGDSSVQTGWVSDDKNVSSDIDCASGSCKAYFWLKLKTTAGSGKTSYQYGIKKNNGSINWLPSSSTYLEIKPSTESQGENATYIVGEYLKGYSVDLKPGDTYCYYLKFKPYGSLGNGVYKTVSACGKALITEFEGQSNVTDTVTSKMGWQKNDKKITVTISGDKCPATTGCIVSFVHKMRRSGGSGTSKFTVTRTSNLTAGDRAIANEVVKTNTFNTSGTNGAEVFKSKQLTLYPGMVVCERLEFDSDNTADKKKVATEVCASVLGNAQPDDPPDPDDPNDPITDKNGNDESSAFIKMEVKNNSVAKFNTYRTIVYAKPGDKLTYRATYNPTLQYTYYLIPERMRIDSGTIYPSSGINETATLGNMFDTYKKSEANGWKNSISVYSTNFSNGQHSENRAYELGSTDRRKRPNDHTVNNSEVGLSLEEIAKTNRNASTQTTPGQVIFTDNGGNLGNVITTSKYSSAYARVPYNFIVDSEITSDDTPIYAGEETTITYDIIKKEKPNSVTTDNGESYATNAPYSISRLIVYYPGGEGEKGGINGWGGSKDDDLCAYYGLANNGTSCGLTDTEEVEKGLTVERTKQSATFYAQDLNAGSAICVAAATYPSSSGADTNWNDQEGSGRWSISDSKCFAIAKKPSLQVWGGNIYSLGAIETGTSKKNNLAGYTGYSINTKNETNYLFGSWGELGLISKREVIGLASGAAMGYSENNGGVLWPQYHPEPGDESFEPLGNNNNKYNYRSRLPGGSVESKMSFCNRSPLSFANNNCNNSADRVTGGLMGTATFGNVEKDKKSIRNKYIGGNDSESYGDSQITLDTTTEGSYYYHYDNLTIHASTIAKGSTKIIRSDGNITIDGDIGFEGGYNTFDDVPKLVIYANNILIGCDVGRIDALLIANNKVVTCNNFEDDLADEFQEKVVGHINDSANSKQLIINGAVIANSLTANRTYGAATGANSIIPAEIINFDPTLYLWGGNKTDDGSKEVNLDITFLNEVSQRY